MTSSLLLQYRSLVRRRCHCVVVVMASLSWRRCLASLSGVVVVAWSLLRRRCCAVVVESPCCRCASVLRRRSLFLHCCCFVVGGCLWLRHSAALLVQATRWLGRAIAAVVWCVMLHHAVLRHMHGLWDVVGWDVKHCGPEQATTKS